MWREPSDLNNGSVLLNINKPKVKQNLIYLLSNYFKYVLIKSSTKTPNIINLMALHENSWKFQYIFTTCGEKFEIKKIQNLEVIECACSQISFYGYIWMHVQRANMNMKWYIIGEFLLISRFMNVYNTFNILLYQRSWDALIFTVFDVKMIVQHSELYQRKNQIIYCHYDELIDFQIKAGTQDIAWNGILSVQIYYELSLLKCT